MWFHDPLFENTCPVTSPCTPFFKAPLSCSPRFSHPVRISGHIKIHRATSVIFYMVHEKTNIKNMGNLHRVCIQESDM